MTQHRHPDHQQLSKSLFVFAVFPTGSGTRSVRALIGDGPNFCLRARQHRPPPNPHSVHLRPSPGLLSNAANPTMGLSIAVDRQPGFKPLSPPSRAGSPTDRFNGDDSRKWLPELQIQGLGLLCGSGLWPPPFQRPGTLHAQDGTGTVLAMERPHVINYNRPGWTPIICKLRAI